VSLSEIVIDPFAQTPDDSSWCSCDHQWGFDRRLNVKCDLKLVKERRGKGHGEVMVRIGGEQKGGPFDEERASWRQGGGDYGGVWWGRELLGMEVGLKGESVRGG
jgi:hypothetical protein